MRRFHSYGPVNSEEYFCVQREDLVRRCSDQLLGRPEKGGILYHLGSQTDRKDLADAAGEKKNRELSSR